MCLAHPRPAVFCTHHTVHNRLGFFTHAFHLLPVPGWGWGQGAGGEDALLVAVGFKTNLEGLALWHGRLSHRMQHQHPIYRRFKSQMLHF